MENKFKISIQTWNEKIEIHGGSYSESYIKYYFENVIKKYEKNTDNPSIRTYVNEP